VDLKSLRSPLYVLATADEESTMAGAKALVASGRGLARYALIGEPTGLRPVNLHKGVMMDTIRLLGRAGHASNPALGISALEGMHAVIGALVELRARMQRNHRNDRFQVPEPTMNLGSVHGGDSPNRICAECELKIDVRPLPGMDLTELRADIHRCAMQAVDGTGLAIEFDPAPVDLPAMETPESSEIVRQAERLAGVPPASVCFGTEGPFFNAMGMETVVLGPGDIDQAHQANEYLDAARIAPMQRILAGMIDHFCMKETAHGR
jgi:acetylornithine deacetylase